MAKVSRLGSKGNFGGEVPWAPERSRAHQEGYAVHEDVFLSTAQLLHSAQLAYSVLRALGEGEGHHPAAKECRADSSHAKPLRFAAGVRHHGQLLFQRREARIPRHLAKVWKWEAHLIADHIVESEAALQGEHGQTGAVVFYELRRWRLIWEAEQL